MTQIEDAAEESLSMGKSQIKEKAGKAGGDVPSPCPFSDSMAVLA